MTRDYWNARDKAALEWRKMVLRRYGFIGGFLLLLFFVCACALLAHGQRENIRYASQYPGSTVAAKIAAAEADCNPNTSIPCTIVIDADLATATEGTLGTPCAQCLWKDYRVAGQERVANATNPTLAQVSGCCVTGPLDQQISMSVPNEGVTGTTALLLAKITANTAQTAAVTDTATTVYPALAAVTPYCAEGTTGNGCLVRAGRAQVKFDAAGGTVGNYVGASTAIAGRGMDLGAATPVGTYCVGKLQETVAANGVGTVDLGNCNLPPASGYASWRSAGVVLPQRTKVDFLSGIDCADNAGATKTDCSAKNPYQFADGTKAAPSAVIGAATRGFYKGGNYWAFADAGTLYFEFGSAGHWLIPTFVFGWCGDANCASTDTGFRRVAAGKVCVGNSGGADCSGILRAAKFQTDTEGSQCISSAAPAVCGAKSAGMVAIPTSGSLVVNTTQATLNSTISFTRDNSLGAKLSVTCNTQSSLTLGTAYVGARVDNTSFTLTLDVAPTTNPVCGSFLIIN